MRRMEKITGRTEDMIILRGVNLFPTQIEELILRTPALSPHFQCVLTREGRLDGMTVTVERRPEATPEAAAAAAEELQQHVKATIGVTIGVTIEVSAMEPGSIERSMGKLRRILDHRPR
jgi:phenylacetate-CoA ligase